MNNADDFRTLAVSLIPSADRIDVAVNMATMAWVRATVGTRYMIEQFSTDEELREACQKLAAFVQKERDAGPT